MALGISAQEEWFAQRRRQFVQKVFLLRFFIEFKPSQVRYRSSVQLKGSLERRSQSCSNS